MTLYFIIPAGAFETEEGAVGSYTRMRGTHQDCPMAQDLERPYALRSISPIPRACESEDTFLMQEQPLGNKRKQVMHISCKIHAHFRNVHVLELRKVMLFSFGETGSAERDKLRGWQKEEASWM